MEKWQRTMLADSMGLQKNERALFLNYASEGRKGAKADTKMLLLKRLYDLTMNGQGDNHQPDIQPLASTKRIEDLEEELDRVTKDYDETCEQFKELQDETKTIDRERERLKERNKDLSRQTERLNASYQQLAKEKECFQRLAQYSMDKRAYDQAYDEFQRERRMPQPDASYLRLDKVLRLEERLADAQRQCDEMKRNHEFFRCFVELSVSGDLERRQKYCKAYETFRETRQLPTRDDV